MDTLKKILAGLGGLVLLLLALLGMEKRKTKRLELEVEGADLKKQDAVLEERQAQNNQEIEKEKANLLNNDKPETVDEDPDFWKKNL